MAGTRTVYVSIGNSDDKLSQAHWSELHNKLIATIRGHTLQVYGDWTSTSTDPWQNACVAFEIGNETSERLQLDLAELSAEYGQDPIAWAEADTRFITPAPTTRTAEAAPGSLADDILDWAREHSQEGSHAGVPLTIEQDPDGTVRIVDPADEVAIDVALLRHPGLSGVAFADGILTVAAEHETIRYRLQHVADHGFTLAFQREN